MSYSESMQNDEDIASDDEPEIEVRNTVVNTLNNVMISHEKENFRHSRDSVHSPGKFKESEEGDSEEDQSEDDNYRQKNNKYASSKARDYSNEESEQASNLVDSDSGEGDNEVLEVDEPLQLVKISDDLTKFEVCEEGLNVLRSIKSDLGIVAMAGAQRTGKSFALNMLLDKLGGKGFKVSPSTSSCTQGIWIWGTPVYVPSRNMYVVLLDTEGSGSIDKNSTHDGKIFALVVLI